MLASSAIKSIKKTVNQILSARFNQFLNKRIPPANRQKLTSKNVFILPTRFGFSYLFLVLLLFFLGTNYQNNAIMLFSYLLASLFITVMMHSFFNFSGLSFKANSSQYGFAKHDISLPLTIYTNKAHFDLSFSFAKSTQYQMNMVHLSQCSQGETRIQLPVEFIKRGVYPLGRLKISSEYSLGLFITWTHLDFNQQAIVYPQQQTLPVAHYLASTHTADSSSTTSFHHQSGMDDFAELKPYIVGEPLTRIAWKQLAKGQEKLTKHYQQDIGHLLWLSLKDMPVGDIEQKLQFLTYLIIENTKAGQLFGLNLMLGNDKPHVNIEAMGSSELHSSINMVMPDTGAKHQQTCLTALARYS